jgi:BirA family biotin operon repressor/biotin-[acetyl-CoA-carboxylase] ligase
LGDVRDLPGIVTCMRSSQKFRLVEFEVLASTNDSILEAGEAGAPEGTTHIAREQTRGRGRGDHVWWSPAGAGLWMSTLLRPPRDRPQWGGISLIAGAAARDALASLGARGVELYWPNDLQVGRRKLGGILGEARSKGGAAWVALGVGINIDLTPPRIRAAMPPGIRDLAISLAECGPPSTVDPLEIARGILERFWPLYERFRAGEALPSLAGDRLAHVGRRVEVRLPGRPPWAGVVEGLSRDGELLVLPDVPQGPPGPPGAVAVSGGEVIYEAAA